MSDRKQLQMEEWLNNSYTIKLIEKLKSNKEQYEIAMLDKIMGLQPLIESNDGIQILKGQIYETDHILDLETLLLEEEVLDELQTSGTDDYN